MRHIRVALPWIILIAACQTSRPPVPVQPLPAEVSLAVRWVRSSAEYHGLVLQIYRAATMRVRELALGNTPGSWGVILDADETVISNAGYQLERERHGLAFTPESWSDWVRRQEAPPLPGAVAFVNEVRRLGGRVVIVTNRFESQCEDTRADLRAFDIPFDAVLCRPDEGGRDKNPRFEAVATGHGSPGLPPLEVLMFLGDNIGDFPDLGQAARIEPESGLAGFGHTYFLLPNPMYGSWVDNPLD